MTAKMMTTCAAYVNDEMQTTTEYSDNLDDDEHSESFSYLWTIENISHYFEEDYRGPTTIFSENFPKYTFRNDFSNQLSVKFYLELVLDGEDEDCEDFVSAFLYMPRCIKPEVILKYSFCVVKANGEQSNFEENRRKFFKGEGWGWREFILRDELLNRKNEIVTEDDKLSIYCEVTVIHKDIVKNIKQIPKTAKIQTNPDSLVKPRSKSIGKLEFAGFSFEGSMFDVIDGKPIVIEDGKVDEMKNLWEYRKGKY